MKFIKHVNWNDFLCGTPSSDYIFQKEDYETQLNKAFSFFKEADVILIGAGAGLSTAGGMRYDGKRFFDNFNDFYEKYGFQDMYSGGFYPFETQEEKWGYWSKNAMINQILPDALPLYKQLYELVKDKEYFVLTTNVDHQFHKAGFDENKIFATQGDYGEIQCSINCSNEVTNAVDLFKYMDVVRKDCKIPTYLVPKCPICGSNMEMHLRSDNYFAEDEEWHNHADAYALFLKNNIHKNIVLLELGVGFNTPVIIRFPFEKMMKQHKNIKFIRLNLNEAVIPNCINDRSVGINKDIASVLNDLYALNKE